MNHEGRKDLLIVSGMSGSGKSTAIKSLEDIGYVCIDNFPPELIQHLSTLVLKYREENTTLVITLDIRSIKSITDFVNVFGELEEMNITYSLLFLDSSDETLLKRYKETRRLHPFMEDANLDIEKSIRKEREFMKVIKTYSDAVIDTSLIRTADLKQRLIHLYGSGTEGVLNVNIISFGFKFGILKDADIIFDVRCLKNPYYDLNLRNKTGNDHEVRRYVMKEEAAIGLFDRIKDYLEYSIPLYELEGKSQLVVGIGCTGGKHRSVTFARLLAEQLKITGVNIKVLHRDINRP